MKDANSIKSIKQLIEWADSDDGNRKSLIIPNLQRDYVWGKPEWRRLWDDIISVLNKIESKNPNDENPQHFTGVVTLKEEQDGEYAVLDGQQRLTTIAILLDYLWYVKDPKNGQTASKLSAFNSRVTFDRDPMESIEDKKNKYIEVYSFFMDCHFEIDYSKVDVLLDIVLNRLFIMLHISAKDENAHDIFEGLNATGKNLEYSDLLLNALLEDATTEKPEKIKEKWEGFLKNICGVEEISFENEEGETVEIEKVKDAPLKLKKYFNALNAMTTGESGSIVESVAVFNAILKRLEGFGNANVFRNAVNSSSDKINTLSKWADVYQMIIDPVGSYKQVNKQVNEKEYLPELYYLSLWNTTAYIPTIMRIIYRNVKLKSEDKGYYSDSVVKNMLKAILSVVVYTRIVLNRVHADDRNVENQIRYLDFIYDANCENKEPEEKYEYIFSIINGLDKVAGEINDKAEEVIKAYQYTSSGSKFLLALYADSMLKDKDKSVCQLESESNKAQVEHMVPQNLSNGSFVDYGYDVSSIGLLDNLILLSANTNNSIGNDKPEDKCEYWKKDCFGELFLNDDPVNWKEPNDKKRLKDTQAEKVNGIIKTFKDYFSITNGQNAATNNNYTFAKKEKKNGRTEILKYEYCKECKAGNSEYHYLVIKDGKYDEVPKSIKKEVDSVFYKEKNSDQIMEDVNFDGLCGIMKSFIEQIDQEPINFYKWLLEREKSIVKFKNGSNEVTKPNRKTFTYSQKMIHTDVLHESDKCSVIMGRKAGKTTGANATGTEYFEINKYKFALSNDFNSADVIKQLQTIYSNYDCTTKKEFGFWVSVTYKIPVFIGNVLIQTKYINIGDTQVYEDWIKTTEEHKKIFENQGSNNSLSVSNVNGEVQSYFKCKRLSFVDLIENGDNIKIPEYQRAYVWDKSNWDALFQQLINNKDNNKGVFLGTIVIRIEDGSLYVVDGQQRLSTLTGFYYATKKDVSQTLPSELLERVKNSNIVSFIEEHKRQGNVLEEINCQFDVIFIKGPKEYQYEVFSSINSAGKKLTEEEKIANFLFAQYPEKDSEEVKSIAHNPGFAKAFCECVTGKFCESTSIYLTFKALVKSYSIAFEQLNNLSCIHRYIKGDNKQNIFKNNNQYPIWLSLLNMLEVTTSDALLLNWTTRLLMEDDLQKSYESFELLTKKICTLYFLLYIMDRSGNAKKSADTNFLNCRELNNSNSLAATVVNSQADQPYWNGQEIISIIAEKIWSQYIRTLPIYDIGQARIKRFILLMLESMMVNGQCFDLKFSDKEFKENVKKQANFDIEHISPASNPKWMSDNVNSTIPSSRLNYLENVMILETDINKAVKDKCLSEKICFKKKANNNGDDSENTKAANYSASTSFMTRMLCKMQENNKKQYYDCEFAEARLNKLEDIILPKLEELLKSVRDDSSIGIPEEKLDLECNLEISTGKKSNSRRKKSQSTVSQEKKSTGKDNLIKVVEYTTQFAVEDQNLNTKWDTAFVKKCREKAIRKIVKELDKEDKYKTTIVSNITRSASINTVSDVDTALLALWRGETNSDLDKILKIIGDVSDSLKSNIVTIKGHIGTE